MVLGALPAPAAAYPGTVSALDEGALPRSVAFGDPAAPQPLGSVSLPSNATVLTASAVLSGSPQSVALNFSHNASVGFPAGTLSGVGISGIALNATSVSGFTEFRGASLDNGSFALTRRTPSGVVLNGTSGSYTTPSIPWNGASFGRLIGNATVPPGSSLTYDVLDDNLTVLASDLRPTELIGLDGLGVPSIRLRATFTAPSAPLSPVLERLGAGLALFESLSPSAASRNASTLAPWRGALELRPSALNWTEYASNPVLGGSAGTWWASGPLPGSVVVVGNETWMYIGAIDGSAVMHIGRMVSQDLGASWTVDATPVLNSTAASWDSALVDQPSVVLDGSTFRMWYMGASTIDQFRIGYATSPDGVTWTKSASNPVLVNGASAWDDWNVGWSSVAKSGSTFYMLYAGRPSSSALKQIGLATSSDGVTWTKSASNPVIARNAISAASFELVPGDLFVVNSTFTLLWMCASGASAYDSCISTSSNAVSWTHGPQNPIITHGDGTWDSVTAEMPVYVPGNATVRPKIFFSGRPGTAAYSMGRADPQFEPPGMLQIAWNLSGQVPLSLRSHSLSAALPAPTSLGASLSGSPDNSTWSPGEGVTANDLSIALSPPPYLREILVFSTSDRRFTPSFFDLRVGYDVYARSGTFVSPTVAAPYPIDNASVTVNAFMPGGTSVSLFLSNDGGATWVAASNGSPTAFSAPGTSFRYKLVLDNTANLTAQVTRVRGTLSMSSTPHDVEVRGDDGTVLALAAGPLDAPRALALSPAFFNARLALRSASDPPVPVPFLLVLSSSTPGQASLDSLRFNLSFPDPLRAAFAPALDPVVLVLGDTQAFRAVASSSPGVAITYAWSLDGNLTGETSPAFGLDSALVGLGNHTLRAAVSNGQFNASHTWNLTVLPVPIYLNVTVLPGSREVSVPPLLYQQFAAVVDSPPSDLALLWTLDGGVVGSADSYNFTAPPEAGAHTLTLRVTGALDSFVWSWAITVTTTPAFPSAQLSAAFAPAGNLTLPLDGTAAFFANLSAPAPPWARFEWRLDGAAVGSNSSSFVLRGATAGSGTHALTVLVRNDTSLAAHAWTVTVPAPPLPPPPTLSLLAPSDNSDTNLSSVRVEGTTAPGARIVVGGLSGTADAAGHFAIDVPLAEGLNTLDVNATDAFGRSASARVHVNYLPPGPPLPLGLTGENASAGLQTPLLGLATLMGAAAAVVGFLLLRERTRRRSEKP